MALGRSGSIAITNAHILTMDPARPTARAMVIHDGLVTYVGSDEGAKTEDRGVDEHIDADGRTVIPGFNDAHGHFLHEGLLATRCDLSDATSAEDAYARIRAYAEGHPEKEILIAERWDESQWTERRYLDKDGLDAIENERPLLARRVDGHMAIANSPLLQVYEDRYDGPSDRIDPKTGLLLEEPALYFTNLYPSTPLEQSEALDAFIHRAHRFGVTSGQSFENVDNWRAWQRKRRERDREGQELGIRMDVATYSEHLDSFVGAGLITGSGDDWLAMGGLKLFVDGSFGARSAYLSEPYTDDPGNHGVPTYDEETLYRLARRAHDGDLQNRTHVIGDAAVEQATHVFERIAEDVGLDGFRDRRHRFEHYELSHPQQWRRAKTLGVVLSMQPNFIGAWAAPTGLYGERLGARHRAANPLRTLYDAGLPIAFGSDIMPFGPLIGIHGAMTAPYPEMRLDLFESLRAYTVGSAYAQHREHVKGMLRPGMLGDAVLFTKDLSIEDPHDARVLDGLDVAATIIDGHQVYRRA